MAKQHDLFPIEAPRTKHPDAPVTVTLHIHANSTSKAWLLSKTGMDRDAQFVPKSVAIQDEHRPRAFTMPRRTALEKGWL